MNEALELKLRPKSLHPTAEAVYRYIIRYKRQHAGESPTRREIGAGVGLSSPSTVNCHLVALERAGRIRMGNRGKSRMITIPGAQWVGPEGVTLVDRGAGDGCGMAEER